MKTILLTLVLATTSLLGGIDPDLIIFFQRGDVNGDGNINITDTIYLGNFLFQGGPPPPCFDAADVNGDGSLNIVDLDLLLQHLFGGGQIPFELVEC
jgi:hypothetical protein